MDQFAAAKAKYEKNRQAQDRPLPKVLMDEAVFTPAPKEKVNSDCILKVTVVLPDGEFTVELVKESVYQNVNRSRVNAVEIKRAIQAGLRPLMGEVK